MKKKVWGSFLFVFLFGLMLSFGSSLAFAETTETANLVTTVEEGSLKYNLFDIKDGNGEHLRYEAHIVGFTDNSTVENQTNLVFPVDDIFYTNSNYPITAINDNAFKDNANIKTIDFNNQEYVVGASAFSGCNNLSEITNAANLSEMGDSCFCNCTNLSKIPDVSGNCTYGQSVYENTGVNSVTFANDSPAPSVKMFYNCTSLTKVASWGNVVTIPESCFSDSGLTNTGNTDTLSFANTTVTNVGKLAFSNTSVEKLNFLNASIDLGEGAFAYCTNLQTISNWSSLPKLGVSSDKIGVFEGCTSLTLDSVTSFPTGVSSLGTNLFLGCSNITSVPDLSNVTTINTKAFSNTGITSLDFNHFSSVTTFGDSVFSGCKSLTTVSSWGSSKFVPSYCFESSALNSVPGFPADFQSIEPYAFSGTALTTVSLEFNDSDVVKEGAFSGCTKLNSVSWNDNFTNIPKFCFKGCSSLETLINFPDNVLLGEGAFAETGLTVVNFNNKPVRCYGAVFSGCKNLKEVKNWNCLRAPDGNNFICGSLFYECSSLETIPDFKEDVPIGPSAFSRTGLKLVDFKKLKLRCYKSAFAYCKKLLEVLNWDNVCLFGGDPGLDEFLFCGCSALAKIPALVPGWRVSESALSGTAITSVSFPEETICEENAFLGCSSLTTVSGWTNLRGNNSLHFADGLFADCPSLATGPVFEDGDSIGSYAFANTGLESLDFNSLTLKCGVGAFSSCKNLKTVSNWDNLVDLDEEKFLTDELFKNCTALANIPNISAQWTHIGNQSFAGCSSLPLLIFIPDTIKTFGENPFSDTAVSFRLSETNSLPFEQMINMASGNSGKILLYNDNRNDGDNKIPLGTDSTGTKERIYVNCNAYEGRDNDGLKYMHQLPLVLYDEGLSSDKNIGTCSYCPRCEKLIISEVPDTRLSKNVVKLEIDNDSITLPTLNENCSFTATVSIEGVDFNFENMTVDGTKLNNLTRTASDGAYLLQYPGTDELANPSLTIEIPGSLRIITTTSDFLIYKDLVEFEYYDTSTASPENPASFIHYDNGFMLSATSQLDLTDYVFALNGKEISPTFCYCMDKNGPCPASGHDHTKEMCDLKYPIESYVSFFLMDLDGPGVFTIDKRSEVSAGTGSTSGKKVILTRTSHALNYNDTEDLTKNGFSKTKTPSNKANLYDPEIYVANNYEGNTFTLKLKLASGQDILDYPVTANNNKLTHTAVDNNVYTYVVNLTDPLTLINISTMCDANGSGVYENTRDSVQTFYAPWRAKFKEV